MIAPGDADRHPLAAIAFCHCRLKALLTMPVHAVQHVDPGTDGRRMETLVTAALVYLAIGAAFFAHPASPARSDDFDWRNQIEVFRATLPDVLGWPVALWRFGRSSFGQD
jgi:hypothetical protein